MYSILRSRNVLVFCRIRKFMMPSEVSESSKVTKAKPATKKNSKSRVSKSAPTSSRKRRPAEGTDDASKYRYVAVDCEFVGVGRQKLSALGTSFSIV